MGTIGIIANPASGKDVRRLVARASVFDNQEKQAIVRRVLVGLVAAGADEVAYLDDRHGIVRTALEDERAPLRSTAVAATEMANALDTISAARALKDVGCDVVITLGGDGTNRAFALGWRDAPLIPMSTGTNNVFPMLVEATIAGAAAGLIASGKISIDEVSTQHKAIEVTIEGEREDLALIDAVLSNERFVGARALLAPEQWQIALLTRADPAAVGMTAIGGLLTPLGDQDEHGLLLELGGEDSGDRVNAPIAPGYYREVAVRTNRLFNFGEEVTVQGPGVLAFDGERERVLKPGQHATFRLSRSGPVVVDVEKTLHLAAEKGCFAR
jgi:predicted polyphosphate/ATP-dependent NAD kinase